MNEQLKDFPIILQQDLIWGDMDAFGHVNNTVFFRYFEDARISYFDRIGVFDIMKAQNIGPILANTECNFKLPLEYPDTVLIGGKATITGPKKLKMQYRVYSEKLQAIAAEGEGLIIYYDYNKAASCEIPQQIATAIESLS